MHTSRNAARHMKKEESGFSHSHAYDLPVVPLIGRNSLEASCQGSLETVIITLLVTALKSREAACGAGREKVCNWDTSVEVIETYKNHGMGNLLADLKAS